VGGVDHCLLLLAAAWHAGGVQIEHYKIRLHLCNQHYKIRLMH
jgi:hypothetical protein